jgi:hypothetical protein
MKKILVVLLIILGTSSAFTLLAQDNKDNQERKDGDATVKKKKRHSVTISNRGIWIESADSAKDHSKKIVDKEKQGKFTTHMGMDLGFNQLIDNTDYTSASVGNYLNVPAAQRNKDLFNLNNGKSINVNIYPWMLKFMALKTHGQKIFISTGIGLQLYNFRYDNQLTYVKSPAGIYVDSVTALKKDKLGLDYLNVPLMFTFKTRIGKEWLVYGVGVTEGYRIASWNKQVSDANGKVKTRGNFDLSDFNTCVTAEIGLDNMIRFYASYQLTSLYSNGIDQHPVSFGFRLLGI